MEKKDPQKHFGRDLSVLLGITMAILIYLVVILTLTGAFKGESFSVLVSGISIVCILAVCFLVAGLSIAFGGKKR